LTGAAAYPSMRRHKRMRQAEVARPRSPQMTGSCRKGKQDAGFLTARSRRQTKRRHPVTQAPHPTLASLGVIWFIWISSSGPPFRGLASGRSETPSTSRTKKPRGKKHAATVNIISDGHAMTWINSRKVNSDPDKDSCGSSDKCHHNPSSERSKIGRRGGLPVTDGPVSVTMPRPARKSVASPRLM